MFAIAGDKKGSLRCTYLIDRPPGTATWTSVLDQRCVGSGELPEVCSQVGTPTADRAGTARGIAGSVRDQYVDAPGPTRIRRRHRRLSRTDSDPPRRHCRDTSCRASSVPAYALSQDGPWAEACIGAGRQGAGPREAASRNMRMPDLLSYLVRKVFRTTRTREDQCNILIGSYQCLFQC